MDKESLSQLEAQDLVRGLPPRPQARALNNRDLQQAIIETLSMAEDAPEPLQKRLHDHFFELLALQLARARTDYVEQ